MPTDDRLDPPLRRVSAEELEQLRALVPEPPSRPDPTERLRERNKLRTRSELSWAAIRLALARGGLEDVRTEEIAEEAGVSPRTFNNYFRSREEAIGAVAGDRARRVALALADRPAAEPFATALAEAVVEEYTRGQEPAKEAVLQLRRLMTTDCGVRPFMLSAMTRLEDELAPVIAERLALPADDLFPRVLAAAVNGAIRVATEYWLRAEAGASYTALLREAVTTAAGLAEHVRSEQVRPENRTAIPAGASLQENANP